MGKVIKKKLNGMSWWMKTSLVLLLTLAASVLMYQGWYNSQVHAAPIAQATWTQLYASATYPAGALTTQKTVNAGTNRLLVVAIASTRTTVGAITVTGSVTWNGKPMTLAAGDMGSTTTTNHSAIYYLRDVDMPATTTTAAVNVTLSGGTGYYTYVYARVYDGVDQTTPLTDKQNFNNATTTSTSVGPFASGLNVADGDQAVEITNIARSSNGTTARTISSWANATWPSPATLTTTYVAVSGPCVGLAINDRNVTTAATETSQHTASNAATYKSLTGISMHAAPSDITPPVAGTLTVSPDSSSSFTSSAPTITGTFTDPETALISCDYTVNGGTNWLPGVTGGTVPNLTCTANPTGLSGALSINMRASSVGGQTTLTQISRTVDTAVPTDGVLTVTSGDTNNSISWTAATDNGGGSIQNYILRFATGATAPANCSAGTAVTGSPFSAATFSAIHNGLTNGTQYSYRLCAVDSLGNTSGGVTGSATPVLNPAKISSCTACHFKPAAVTANAGNYDGSGRNNPAGLFQGSHNKHANTAAIACTVCHNDNGTDFGHSEGVININGTISGGSYSRINPAVSNTFSPGTCSNTYCHSNGTSVKGGTISGTTPSWGGSTNCGSCHGTLADNGRPNYANGGQGTATANTHGDGAGYGNTHKAQACTVCHSGITGTPGAYVTSSTHANGTYDLVAGVNYNATNHTCTNVAGCHATGTVTWGASLACIDCHASAQGTRSAVVGEFGLAWGHKKSGRGAVTDADCIVCHLEGKYTGAVGTAVIKSAFHSGAPNGNIDLRDPDGVGEAAITNISGTAFTFTKFAMSFAAGSRTTTGHTSNTDIANVISQKFCLACHDSNGATNTTARSTAASTAVRPFNNLNLGANYTVLNGAATATGDLIDVKKQFTTTFSSVHPILGPLNRDFPIASRLAVPYNGQAAGRVAAGGVKSLSVVMNCFDCHNTPTTPLTNRTVSAHGNAVTLRGTINTTTMTLCAVCHTGYTVANNHGSGSAMSMSTGRSGEGFNSGCYSCHGDSGDTDAAVLPTTARPVNAQNYHGFNTLVGGVAKWPSASGGKPYAFIRNTVTYAGATGYHRPLRGIGELTTGSATCMGGSGCAGNGGAEPYTPGGQY